MIRDCPLQPKGSYDSSLQVLECVCVCVNIINVCVWVCVSVWKCVNCVDSFHRLYIYSLWFPLITCGCRALLSTRFKHCLYRRHVYKCPFTASLSLFPQSYYDCMILTIIVKKELWTSPKILIIKSGQAAVGFLDFFFLSQNSVLMK